MVTTPTSALLAIGGIIFVDLVLNGDNALVIGAAASTIPPRQRLMALVLGGIGAILIRIVFTSFATFILNNPYVEAIGGALILLIAIRLLFEENNGVEADLEKTIEKNVEEIKVLPALVKRFSSRLNVLPQGRVASDRLNLIIAILTIIIADITMSLDNILAIGALAAGNILFISIGLILSIVLLMLGSALVATLMTRFPWLIIGASFILAGVAADLFWRGTSTLPIFTAISLNGYHILLFVVTFALIFLFLIIAKLKTIKKSL